MFRLDSMIPRLAVVLLAFAAGCSRPVPPLDEPVHAVNAPAFQQWRGDVLGRLSPPQQQALDTAARELRLSIMTSGVSGSEAIDEVFRQRVDGKPLRELIRAGYAARLQRLVQQREENDTILKRNAELTTRPGDTDSADYLARNRDEQASRRDAVQREIGDTQKELAALGISIPTPEPVAAPAAKQLPSASAAGTSSAQSSAESGPDSMPVRR